MKRLILVMGLVILEHAATVASAEGLEFLRPRNQAYFLRVSRSASYQLAPGDYVEVNVVSSVSGERIRRTLMKKIQVVEISNVPRGFSLITLNLNKREVVALNTALTQPKTVAALRLVQKQPRTEQAAAPPDVLPDLNFEDSREVVSAQLQ